MGSESDNLFACRLFSPCFLVGGTGWEEGMLWGFFVAGIIIDDDDEEER